MMDIIDARISEIRHGDRVAFEIEFSIHGTPIIYNKGGGIALHLNESMEGQFSIIRDDVQEPLQALAIVLLTDGTHLVRRHGGDHIVYAWQDATGLRFEWKDIARQVVNVVFNGEPAKELNVEDLPVETTPAPWEDTK